MRDIIIGSRGSDLALWQANHVKSQLEKLGHKVVIKIIITQGDAFQNLSFDKLEGKGFFTKEIETELLDRTIDLAVHSHKDLETNPPAGLIIGAVSERENPADILLIQKSAYNKALKFSLKSNPIVGTSSARRKAQMLQFRPDVELKELRGNLPTRIDKLRQGGYDAILLAKAGIDRLKIDLSEFETFEMDPTEFVPAPAQGVLALQIREHDLQLKEILTALHNTNVYSDIAFERGVLNKMEGGCHLPLGVYSKDSEIFVSYSSRSDEPSKNYTFSKENPSSVVDQIVSVLNKVKNETIH
ncbi:MAG: hydroxymethylbilane synthase [Bacteroidetes bacterium]|nr:hydroxymethylbilane synthase [Bacteroidota bacterium]